MSKHVNVQICVHGSSKSKRRSKTSGLRHHHLMNQLSVVNSCHRTVQVYSGWHPQSQARAPRHTNAGKFEFHSRVQQLLHHTNGNQTKHTCSTVVKKFTGGTRGQQLDQSSQQGSTFYLEVDQHKQRMDAGFRSRRTGCLMRNTILQQAAKKQSVCQLCSSGSGSSGLLRLHPQHL